MTGRTMWIAGLWLVLTPHVARALDYFPLELGLYWEYHDPYLQNDVRIDNRDVETVRDREVVRRMNVPVTAEPDEYWNYWSQDPEGRLYLHGFRRPNQNLAIGYEPPILWLDPTGGDASPWTTTFQILDLETEQSYGSLMYEGRIAGAVTVTVPAGTFDALQVAVDEYPVTFGLGPHDFTCSLTGALVPAPLSRDPIEAKHVHWYVDGIGLVQEALGVETFIIRELLRSNVPLDADRSSWSELKGRFGE